MEENKIVIYQTEDGQTQIDVRLENDTVWLTQAQMVDLFQTTKQNVSLHVGNVFKEGELEQEATVKEYLTVQKEGKEKSGDKLGTTTSTSSSQSVTALRANVVQHSASGLERF